MSPITNVSEGVDEARRRLAQQARDQGVRLRLAADGRWSASSVSQPGTWHYVTGFSCDCPGFIAHGRCMHHSALLACLGWLPDDGPTDPDPTPLAITLVSSHGYYRLAGEDAWREPLTTILIDGVEKVRIEGDTNGVQVHWLEDGQPIDDLTDCTPILLDHHGAVAFWIESLDLSVPAQTVMERSGLRRTGACPDAAWDRSPGGRQAAPHRGARPMTMHVRRWCVTDIPGAEHLAAALTGQVWCGCTGFRFGGHLWLNDATSPDGAQEFAVIRERDHAQVESVTFGWVDATRGLAIINEIVAGMGGDASISYGGVDPALIETPAAHGRCRHCA